MIPKGPPGGVVYLPHATGNTCVDSDRIWICANAIDVDVPNAANGLVEILVRHARAVAVASTTEVVIGHVLPLAQLDQDCAAGCRQWGAPYRRSNSSRVARLVSTPKPWT